MIIFQPVQTSYDTLNRGKDIIRRVLSGGLLWCRGNQLKMTFLHYKKKILPLRGSELRENDLVVIVNRA